MRLVADWLKDDTYGVAAKLAALPKDVTGEGAVTIADLGIIDETRHGKAATRTIDRSLTLPGVIVTSGTVTYTPATPIQLGSYADAMVEVMIRYADRETDPDVAWANGDYVTKAVLASLRQFHIADATSTRTRNSVSLLSCEELAEQGIFEPNEGKDAWVVAGVLARYYARTIIPLGS